MLPKMLKVFGLVVLCFNSCLGIQYLFSMPEYSINEDGTPSTTVSISRTESVNEIQGTATAQRTTVVINTVCPSECPTVPAAELALSGTDYTISSTTIVFPSGVSSAPVTITATDDSIEEQREYFCLSIVDAKDRGSQWYTRVAIPWNDHCVEQVSIFDGGNMAAPQLSLGYFIDNELIPIVSHVGPWWRADAPTLTINVTPQPLATTIGGSPGDGNDLNIFLSNRADVNAFNGNSADGSTAFGFYGLHLDDSEATLHVTNKPGSATLSPVDDDSWVDNGGLSNVAPMAGMTGHPIGRTPMSTPMVQADQTNTYTITHTDAGTTTLTKSPSGPTLQGTGGTASGIDNLFVTSALNKIATWEICGLEPRRLPIVSAKASGHYQTFAPELAVDNVIWPTSCFRSEPANGKNWLQIDMGKEFHVKKVLIYPLQYGEDLPIDIMNPTWLNNLKIYVGSCKEDRAFTDNNVCTASIGTTAATTPGAGAGMPFAATDQELIIDVNCNADAYGRYVYIAPVTDSTRIGFCEVRLFGSEIPIAKETKVYFAQGDEAATAAEGTTASLTVTRFGTAATCSYIDYYTDRATNDDFTEVFPAASLVIPPNTGSATTATVPLSIPITADNECEGTEAFRVYLSNIDGGVLGFQPNSQCYATVSITDDDTLTYALAASASSIAEGPGVTLGITVSRTGTAASQAGSASVTFTGVSATHGEDFTTDVLQHVTFTNANTPQLVSVPIVDDPCYEQPETLQVNLDNLAPTCSMPQAGLPLTVTISDNDSKFEWDTSGTTNGVFEIREGMGPYTIKIDRVGTLQDKNVEFGITYAGADNDDISYVPADREVTIGANQSSGSVTINVIDDAKAEGDEYFTLTLTDPSAGDCSHGNRGANYQLTVRIVDNDWLYNWEEATYQATEGAQLQVCLRRENAEGAPAINVAISGVTGTAITGDYSVPGTISFLSGSDKGCGNIQISNDNNAEPTETFTVIIDAGQTGVVGGRVGTATVTISDDAETVGFESTTYQFTEGSTSTQVFITHNSNNDVSISVSSGLSTATSGADFTPVSQTLTLSPSQTRYPLAITIIDDELIEPSETVILSLTSSNTRVNPATTSTMITIIDDDSVPQATDAPSGGLSGGAIAGIVAGSVLGLIILVSVIVIVFCVMTGRRLGPQSPPRPPGANNVPTVQNQAGQLVPLDGGMNAYGVYNNAFGNYRSQLGGYYN